MHPTSVLDFSSVDRHQPLRRALFHCRLCLPACHTWQLSIIADQAAISLPLAVHQTFGQPASGTKDTHANVTTLAFWRPTCTHQTLGLRRPQSLLSERDLRKGVHIRQAAGVLVDYGTHGILLSTLFTSPQNSCGRCVGERDCWSGTPDLISCLRSKALICGTWSFLHP